MATMTITVTVTGRHAGNTITWSRTSTVENLLSATHGVGNAHDCGTSQIIGDEQSPGLSIGDVTTLGVFAAIHNSENGLMLTRVEDENAVVYRMGVFPAGLPFFVYNGSGTDGYNGGINDGASGATPTNDIRYAYLDSFVGAANWSFLAGFKLIS
jgi:hypothetical protein